MYRKEAIAAVTLVQVEHRVAAWAVDRCRGQAQIDPTILDKAQIALREVLRCSAALEATYVIRLFAVFESHLREIRRAFGRDTFPIVRDLIDGCAARQLVDHAILARAHRIREYRNSLVHGGDAMIVALVDARQDLCTFLGRMPYEW